MTDDASSKVPYLQAYGNVKKALDKITKATVPPTFTQDFLATTLSMPGGGARPVIKFLKRAGFLTSDGTPTDLYKQFRNPSLRGAAAAQGLRTAILTPDRGISKSRITRVHETGAGPRRATRPRVTTRPPIRASGWRSASREASISVTR